MQRFSTVTVTTPEGEEVQLLHHLVQPHCVTEDNVDRVVLMLVPTAAYDELERRLDSAAEAAWGPRMTGVRLGGIGPRPGIYRTMTAEHITQNMAMR